MEAFTDWEKSKILGRWCGWSPIKALHPFPQFRLSRRQFMTMCQANGCMQPGHAVPLLPDFLLAGSVAVPHSDDSSRLLAPVSPLVAADVADAPAPVVAPAAPTAPAPAAPTPLAAKAPMETICCAALIIPPKASAVVEMVILPRMPASDNNNPVAPHNQITRIMADNKSLFPSQITGRHSRLEDSACNDRQQGDQDDCLHP